MPTLTIKQRGVLKGMLTGVAITLVVLAAAVAASPFPPPADASPGARIAFALKADVLLALWLAWCIGRLAQHRFFTPEDIDGSGLTEGTERAKRLQSILQNSLEQTVLAALVHTAWAVALPAHWLSAIPAAVVLFLCGRVLFARGYGGGAPSRALGFALTFYPTVAMAVVAVAAILFASF
jgi:hypothetical protein